MNALFYASGAIAVIAALLVITSTNATHAVVYLVLTFLAIASVFFTLGAPFVAVLQIVIYAGAIIVLFVFIVMMLNLGETAVERERVWLRWPVWVLPLVIAGLLLIELVSALGHEGANGTVGEWRHTRGGEWVSGRLGEPEKASPPRPLAPSPSRPLPSVIGPKAVGISLYSGYIIGVELASMLLLAALMAGFHFGMLPRHQEADDE